MAEVEILNYKEFRAALREVEGNWDSAMSLAHQKIGTRGAGFARARARGMGGVQAKAASAIGEKHTPRFAAVAVMPSAVDRMGNAAFWGAKRHTGWYDHPRYQDSAPQHPPWVGSSWDVAEHGQGPYAINEALAANIDELLDEYLVAIDGIAKRAFPEGGA